MREDRPTIPDALPDGPLSPGTIVDGVTIDRVLGFGKTSVVYAGADPFHGQVALKMLLPHALGEPVLEGRFLREMRIGRELAHPSIVRVHRTSLYRELPLMVMEYAAGTCLSDKVKRDGPLPLDEIREVGLALLDALAFVHAHDVVHRDLKPEHVRLTEPSVRGAAIKLIDFGLSKSERPGTRRFTGEGVLLGTPSFMAPEQATGDAVDHRIDIYSAGAVLYHAAIGHPPFKATRMGELLRAVVGEAPTPPSERRQALPARFDDVVMRALAKEPSDRFPDARAMADALADAI